jgi:hypothetical protein
VTQPPKWYMPVTIIALLWNLMGCAAYVMDMTMSPEAVAALTDAQRAMYEARPAWAVAAYATAVWAGAAGSLGLVLRKTWAMPLLLLSLVALVVQDVALFGMSGATADSTAVVLQSMVMIIAIGLVLLARKAASHHWIN